MAPKVHVNVLLLTRCFKNTRHVKTRGPSEAGITHLIVRMQFMFNVQ